VTRLYDQKNGKENARLTFALDAT